MSGASYGLSLDLNIEPDDYLKGGQVRGTLKLLKKKKTCLRLLLWGQGCLCKRGTHIHWLENFMSFTLALIRFKTGFQLAFNLLWSMSGGRVRDGLGPWSVDKRLDTAGETVKVRK